jgi:hypothetical protein
MKFSTVAYSVIAFWMSFATKFGVADEIAPELNDRGLAPELNDSELAPAFNDRELAPSIECYYKCKGYATGWCQKVYPQCYPLRRNLRGENDVANDEASHSELIVLNEENSRGLESGTGSDINEQVDDVNDSELVPDENGYDGNDRELAPSIACYYKCKGYATGWCSKVYKDCYPL